jgi:hypothetical protein
MFLIFKKEKVNISENFDQAFFQLKKPRLRSNDRKQGFEISVLD